MNKQTIFESVAVSDELPEKSKHPGWHDGSCCCNCKNLLRLTKHPFNDGESKGAISEPFGYACIVRYDCDPGSQEGMFFTSKHGMCELHQPLPSPPNT